MAIAYAIAVFTKPAICSITRPRFIRVVQQVESMLRVRMIDHGERQVPLESCQYECIDGFVQTGERILHERS